jgi:AraC family transcriptional regulator
MQDPLSAISQASSTAYTPSRSDSGGTVSCAALQASYIPGVDRTCLNVLSDDLAIVLPCNLTEFRAHYPASSGRSRSVAVREPCVCVVPPGRCLELRCPRPADLLVIHVDPRRLADRIREETGRRNPSIAARYCAFDPLLREVGNTLCFELRRRTIPSRTSLEALADVIALHLAQHYEKGSEAHRGGLSPVRLHKVQAFIHAHLSEALSLTDLAGSVHMSTFHFARMFKKATGEAPHLYLTGQRVHKASELLLVTELPLVEIAARVGFQSQGHFTSVFHRYTGTTPRAYRQRHHDVLRSS